jgi:branched-chain amino acid transport system permease protein
VIAEVTRLLVAQWKTLGGGTGTSLPREATADIMGVEAIARTLFGLRDAAARDVLAYWLALALAVGVTMAAIYALLRSRTGLALAAVRDNDKAARSVGVDARRVKWQVFLAAAAFGTGLVGALIYVQTARISPDAAFSVTSWTAYVIFIVVIGGIGRWRGRSLASSSSGACKPPFPITAAGIFLPLAFWPSRTMLFAPRGPVGPDR